MIFELLLLTGSVGIVAYSDRRRSKRHVIASSRIALAESEEEALSKEVEIRAEAEEMEAKIVRKLQDKISKKDLMEIKKYYREPIQQGFIDKIIKEVGL